MRGRVRGGVKGMRGRVRGGVKGMRGREGKRGRVSETTPGSQRV